MIINNIMYYKIPFIGDYFISKDGEIFSTKSKRVLKPCINPKGYKYVTLSGQEFNKKYRVHRLVALTFLGICPTGMVVRHLDGNSLNNNINNLCYGTQSENEQDSILHGTHYRNTKITKEQAIEIAKDTRAYKEIAKDYNLNAGYVSDIKIGIYWGKETEGVRFQRGRKTAIDYINDEFTKEEIAFILDKNNKREDISKKLNIPLFKIKKVRKQSKILG